MKFKDFAAKKEFTQKRLDGAKKTARLAQGKGGPAILSYHHFRAKFPKYRRAITDFDNKRDPKWLKSEYNRIKSRLNIDKLSQEEFQKLSGELEAIGELYIKLKTKS